MVWPSQVLSKNRDGIFSKKHTVCKSATKATVKEESANRKSDGHIANSGTVGRGGGPAKNWPSVVLDDARKLTKYHKHQKAPKCQASDNGTGKSAKAWPSDVVLDDPKYATRIQRQEPPGMTAHATSMNHQTDLWPSLVLEEKLRNKRSEGRNDRSTTRMQEQYEERDGMIDEYYKYTLNRHQKLDAQLGSPRSDHLSYATSYSNGDSEDDETRSHGAYTYDSKSIGISTLTSRTTLRTGSFSTRDLDSGCYLQDNQANCNPSVPPRNAESNNLVSALVHLTKNCYSPADPDLPY
ncbi:unnamed protein product [Cylindrotheca closterium]|uniref:Uncharacterized protein n=1 Tax=Cylindrotheca closterium TaxID=2856 RepID=A0AAD2CID4_9STRA|nr:unnamed protein product [Cylindrotheca closterium]